MNKYLKLFGTEDEFISCLEAKIAGNNDIMGFPNVSVIGVEDNNGNFSASKIHYINGRTKAETILSKFLNPETPENDNHWVNPTNITTISGHYNIDTIEGRTDASYGISFTAVRFQPYDWYDEETDTTYYAFIGEDAYNNIVYDQKNIDVLSANDMSQNLLLNGNGYNANPVFSNYHYPNEVDESGIILYLTNLSEYFDQIYQREFHITKQNELVFGDIEPFPYGYYSHLNNQNYVGGIEGYVNSDSGSDSGSGSGSGSGSNSNHWINPTIVNVVSNRFDLETIHILVNSGYDGDITGYRFQPYDWYDEDSGETYYAFISPDAYHNITNYHYGQSVDLLDGNAVGDNLLEGPGGYDSNKTFFTEYRRSDIPPAYQGKIVYVKDISEEHPVELYERQFEITLDNYSNKILTFYDISPIRFDAGIYSPNVYTSHGTVLVDKGIEGYVYLGSGSGSGDDNGYYSY